MDKAFVIFVITSEAILSTMGLAQSWLFGHGWPYTFAPQEWRANVMPSAFTLLAASDHGKVGVCHAVGF